MDDATPRRKRRKVRLRVKLIGLSAVSLLILLVGEIAARIAYPVINPSRHFRPGLYVADEGARWVHKPSYEGICANYYEDLVVHINSAGLRGPELSPDDATREVRVLCLGDSNTFGLRVSDEETFPAALRRELAASGKSFAVWNTGHCGYNTEQELVMLKRFGPRLRPNVVVLGWLQNDLLPTEALPAQVIDGYLAETPEAYEKFKRKTLQPPFWKVSRLATLVSVKQISWRYSRAVQTRLERDAKLVVDPQHYARCLAAVREIARLTKEMGARLLVISYSSNRDIVGGERNIVVKHFEEDMAKDGQQVLSVFDLFRPELSSGRALFVPRDDAHPTGYGHALTAKALAPRVLEAAARKGP